MTMIIAHRGSTRPAAENTVAAFLAAVERGADGIELDVRRTADDRLVVRHDPVLADGRAVRSVPAADLPPDVPTLADALDACAGVFVNIEIKNDPTEPDFDPADWVAHRLVAELARRGGGPRWLVSSFRRETVDRVHALLPAVRTAWLVEAATIDTVRHAATGGHIAIHPWVQTLDAATVHAAHRAGIAVNAWTCNDPDRIAELLAWGVDGIVTDVVDVALGVRRDARRTG